MLSVRNLVKVYPGPVTALQGVSLDIGTGMFGLLGPNGAGKSTFMRILAGVLEPTSGTVTLDGRDVLADPGALWSVLGYLPQDFGFFPHLTGEAMLEYLLQLKGVASGKETKKLAASLLERVNLAYAARRKVKEYSGGMRQRLGIAQAVAGDPRLIIVDEPTAGLDPVASAALREDLASLAAGQGVTIFLTTHNLVEAERLCDLVGVIRKGKLAALGPPSSLRTTDLSSVHIVGTGIDQEIVDMATMVPGVLEARLMDGGLEVKFAEGARPAALVAMLVERGVGIDEVRRDRQTLEQTFLELVADDEAAAAPARDRAS